MNLNKLSSRNTSIHLLKDFFVNFEENFKIVDKSWIIFLPAFLMYLLICIVNIEYINDGDSIRYQFYADNLLSGYFSDRNCIDIWNGPGLPIFIAFVKLLGLPVFTIIIFNCLFYYASVVLTFKCVKYFSNIKLAYLFAIYLACYYPSIYTIRIISTEPIVQFLIALFAYTVIKNYETNAFNIKHIIISGLLFGYIILTKVIFGYVYPVMMLLSLPFVFFKKTKMASFKSISISLVAFAFTLPWLIYTYSLTGKIFFWAASGGENLYVMTSPYDDETGQPIPVFVRCKNKDSFNWENGWIKTKIENANNNKRHGKIAKTANAMGQIESDEYLKKCAIENIKNNPTKYLKNICANISRFCFGRYERNVWYSLFMIIPIIPVILLFPYALFINILNIKKSISSLTYILCIIVIYFAGSILLTGLHRQLIIILPLILNYMAYYISKSINVKLEID